MTPLEVTNFERGEHDLQRFWLFCIIVAGKQSDWAARTVEKLVSRCPSHQNLIDWLNSHQGNALHNTLVANKVGQYGRIVKAVRGSFGLNLQTATVEQLEGVFGVGPKTARFFILHTRQDARVAVLDTHILKWLNSHKLDMLVPSSTPQKRETYKQLEGLWLALTDAQFGRLPKAQVDLLLWCQESGRLTDDLPFADDLQAWDEYSDELFMGAVLGLREHYACLEDTDVLHELRCNVVDFPNTGNQQTDYENVRDQVEQHCADECVEWAAYHVDEAVEGNSSLKLAKQGFWNQADAEAWAEATPGNYYVDQL